ncbi:unnamed protein product [Ilex paraguariensis]|uniref:Uncharacterized protein n=1 Tax=Ilex paraguariensis TaxID=185542 RepID=A0ABC8UBL3_9AQUA
MDIQGKIETIEIKVEYQWRPKICHNCCIFGHNKSTCPKQRTVESWKPKPAPLQANSVRLDKGKTIATMIGLEQQEAGQTQAKELIGGYQASSSVTVKNNMGMVIQGGASNSSQQDILGHDHHITKITVNESTPPQLLMQAVEIEPEANVPNETIEDVRKEEEPISAKLQQMPNKKKKGKKKYSKSKSSTRRGQIVVDLRVEIEPEANVPNETIEDVRKEEEPISAKLQQMPNKKKKGKKKYSKSKVAEHHLLRKIQPPQ